MTTLLLARFCGASSLRVSGIKQLTKNVTIRNFQRNSKETVHRTARRATLKEQALAPPGEGAYGFGKAALAGGAVLGLGSLCYYGLGLSDKPGALEHAHLWPQYVKDRIKSTYLYLGSSLVITASSAYASFRSPVIMNLVTRNGFMGLAISLAAIMGTGMLAQGIEYKEGFGAKQMAWALHAGVMGAMLAPLCFLGGPILIRAAWYTAGIVGGLSTVAVCAPSEKFLMMGGPLAMGLGVVFVSSIGSMFLSPATALGAGLYSMSLYGGLLLFSAFILYDTQRLIAQAERYPTTPALYGIRPYDPVNASLSLYMDILNIFIRIATMLAGGGGNRRK